MAYVLEYTVVPENGKPRIVKATSHLDALASVVKDLSTLRTQSQIDQANYEPEPGEVITVVGFSQDEYSGWHTGRTQKSPQNHIVRFEMQSFVSYRAKYLDGLPDEESKDADKLGSIPPKY